jgi:hypothetical protein
MEPQVGRQYRCGAAHYAFGRIGRVTDVTDTAVEIHWDGNMLPIRYVKDSDLVECLQGPLTEN